MVEKREARVMTRTPLTPEEAIFDCLARRGPAQTICPSEAARLLAGQAEDWRAEMERVHEATDTLLEKGDIRLSWRGIDMKKRRGPYRIARR